MSTPQVKTYRINNIINNLNKDTLLNLEGCVFAYVTRPHSGTYFPLQASVLSPNTYHCQLFTLITVI